LFKRIYIGYITLFYNIVNASILEHDASQDFYYISILCLLPRYSNLIERQSRQQDNAICDPSDTSLNSTESKVCGTPVKLKTNGIHPPPVRPALATPEHAYSQSNRVSIVGIMHDRSFDPNPIVVNSRSSITWTNDHNAVHTVTSGRGDRNLDKGKLFDSGFLGYGQLFTHTFEMAGTFDYFCKLHPFMIGQVVVVK
jgi:plastocyanin